MGDWKTDISNGAQVRGRGFFGAKVAVLLGAEMPVILRDDRADIPYPAHWDLPGGGREGGESPLDCALRETQEELGLVVAPEAVHWGRMYADHAGREVWFFVARLDVACAADIRLGDEGQGWRMMTPAGYLAHPRGIAPFQQRLRNYLMP